MKISNDSVKCIPSALDFFDQLRNDISVAKDRVWIQCMSFEGDAIGQQLTEALISSPASDKRLMVDSYSKLVHNDTVLAFPTAWINIPLLKERYQTDQCWKKMKKNKVQVHFTNPLGILGIKYPMRNHKKMIIIDDHVYIGGRNFCAHNFKWNDLMVKIKIPSVTAFLIKDFSSTWSGTDLIESFQSNIVSGWLLNGFYSEHHYNEIINCLSESKKSIEVVSPYISGPFLRKLCHIAREKSIDLKLYIPENNNKPIITGYLNYYQSQFPLKICYIQGDMNHSKVIISDDQKVWFGSCNFDCISYCSEQPEIVISFNDQDIVKQFKNTLFNEMIWQEKIKPTTSKLRQYASYKLLQLVEWGLIKKANRS